jgi:hypothetical protein
MVVVNGVELQSGMERIIHPTETRLREVVPGQSLAFCTTRRPSTLRQIELKLLIIREIPESTRLELSPLEIRQAPETVFSGFN